MEESPATQTHLSNVLAFLRQKNSLHGFKTLKNAIQIKLNRIKPTSETEQRKKLSSSCPRCYTHWKEGNFSVRFKPKYKSGKNISKRMVLKCSVCNHKEYQSYQQRKDDFRINKSKVKPNTRKSIVTVKSKSKTHTKVTSSKIQSKTKNNPNKQSKKNKLKQKVKKKVNR
ncbi:uncharacterized protein LOC135841984 [Planococcus citri]|uniref:uncharacterized protein LOC135841984 n=1 Tax=Planococcus citri TaxID=170843 RepID=UPI0031FA1E8F